MGGRIPAAYHAAYYQEHKDRIRERTRDYRRAWARERYKTRRANALVRLGGRCVSCGATEFLQFDHIDPATKEVDMYAVFRSYSKARVEAELAKCQLLCPSCHGVKSLKSRPGFEHIKAAQARRKK